MKFVGSFESVIVGLNYLTLETPQKTCCIGGAFILIVLARLYFFFIIILFLIGTKKSVSHFRMARENNAIPKFVCIAHSGKYFEYSKATTKNKVNKTVGE